MSLYMREWEKDILKIVSHGNRTGLSTIQEVTRHIFSELAEREANLKLQALKSLNSVFSMPSLIAWL